MAAFAAILRKDLTIELRSGESTIALVALSLLVMVVIVFALSQAGARGTEAAAGALWTALVFAGMIGATRSMASERENGCIRAILCGPVDRATLYAAKLAGSIVFMGIAEVSAVILMVLFFNLEFNVRLLLIAPVLAMGIVGFAALAVLLAAISGRLRTGDLILPMLIVPIYVPALMAGVKASGALLSGAGFLAIAPWVKILIAFDLLFVAAGCILFEHVVGED
jgi:heme exporter protein B